MRKVALLAALLTLGFILGLVLVAVLPSAGPPG